MHDQTQKPLYAIKLYQISRNVLWKGIVIFIDIWFDDIIKMGFY